MCIDIRFWEHANVLDVVIRPLSIEAFRIEHIRVEPSNPQNSVVRSIYIAYMYARVSTKRAWTACEDTRKNRMLQRVVALQRPRTARAQPTQKPPPFRPINELDVYNRWRQYERSLHTLIFVCEGVCVSWVCSMYAMHRCIYTYTHAFSKSGLWVAACRGVRVYFWTCTENFKTFQYGCTQIPKAKLTRECCLPNYIQHILYNDSA